MPPAATERLRPYLGREVTLGIRPEDLACRARTPIRRTSPSTPLVEVVEKLGSEILLDLKVGRGAMVAAVEPTIRVTFGDRLRMALNPAACTSSTHETEAAI